MPTTSHSTRSSLTHVLVWLGFACYEQAIVLATRYTNINLIFTLLNYVLNAILFYACCNIVLPRFCGRERYLLCLLGLLIILASYGVCRCELALHLAPALHLPVPTNSYTYWQLWLSSIYRGTFFVFASAGLWFARNTIELEKKKLTQEHQLREAESGLMRANLAFLKSQINPHFLFNSLNFLYAQVYPHSARAAKGILLLSDTMRYALHEDNNGKVMLTEEVNHIRNYIEMNQLRFSGRLQISFEVIGNTQFLMILPLVLITFVENCFKHGELGDAGHPLVIRLKIVQNRLTFSTHNRKRFGPKEKSTGIGLPNTIRRLDILYPDRYELVLDENVDSYTCTLILDL